MKARHRLHAAFTLTELLIAVAITALIVVLLGTMFVSLTNTTSRANQRTDAFRDARSALQMIQRDFNGLVAVTPPAKTLSSDPDPARLAPYFVIDNLWQDGNDPYTSPAGANFNMQLFALIALKNQPPGNPVPSAGDLCAVGYYCSWDNSRHCYSLRRHFRDSAATFLAFQSNSAGIYIDPTNLYVPAATDDVLANYVWNLKLTAYDALGVAINPKTVNNVTVTTIPYICDVKGTTATTLPAAIEVSFNAISSEAARTIMSISSSNPADWMDATLNYQRLIAPHMYEFRTRIFFH